MEPAFSNNRFIIDHLHLPIKTTGSIIKEGIVNLSGEELHENKIKLLNLALNLYLRKSEKDHTLDIIQTTEICALDLERERKFSVAESLRQNIRRIITKDLKKKHENN